MAHQLNERSLNELEGVNPDLMAVVFRASEISSLPFQISCGLRTVEEQRELVEEGASWTMDSKHLTGDAIDFFVTTRDGKRALWDFHLYARVSDAFKQAARELGIKINWGGDWKIKRDGPHIELAKTQAPHATNRTEAPFFALRIGMVGDLVRTVQVLLRSLGYPLKVDGDFGPATRRAVTDLQTMHGLKITGDVDNETLKKLNQLNEEKTS